MKKEQTSRNRIGVITSAVGIALNVLLCVAKIAVGAIFKSVAVMGDGFNNLTDAGSSAVSMLGFRFANKPADKEHPFGHARYEYITGLIVAFIVLFLGLQLGRDSIDKIINKGTTDASLVTIFVLVGAIAVKVFMFFYYKRTAKKINSLTLHAAAIDSLNDTVSTGVVLICAIVAYFTELEIDAYAGIAVALFIIINGVKLCKETVSPLLGEKPNPELIKEIEERILSYDGVKGIHDLIVHNYGPNKNFVSVHVEVDASVDILISHETVDKIERDLLEDGINVVVHMDPIICDDERVDQMKALVVECAKEIDGIFKVHDFRVVWGENRINLIFDVEVPFGYKMTDKEIVEEMEKRVRIRDDRCRIVATIDKSYVDNI